VADLKDKARRVRFLSGRGFNHEHVAHACSVCEREDL
jgi:SOS response regulatory protein OraA/RecX